MAYIRNSLREIHSGCQICGTGRPRYTWNSSGIFGFHACYDCYIERYKIDTNKIEMELRKKAEENTSDDTLYFMEINKLQREYVREVRKSKGVIDPELTCVSCGKQQSVFEFSHIGNSKFSTIENICFSCLDKIDVCPVCKDKRDNDFMRKPILYYEDTYLCFKHSKEKKTREEQIEKWLSSVNAKQCISALKYRKMDINRQNIEMIEQLILAKRINKEINEKLYYESRV